MFSQVSVHSRAHGYSVTGHLCHGAVGTHPTGMVSCDEDTFYQVGFNTNYQWLIEIKISNLINFYQHLAEGN